MSKSKTPRKKSQKHLLVESLLQKDGASINWPMEMKMLGRLLSKYSDLDFWFDFASKNKYPTLLYLFSDLQATNIVHKAFIDYTKRKKLELKTPEPINLSQEKVGEDIIVTQQKPKTLLDFINS